MSFRYSVTARFHEVDRAGIVFFGHVFEYAHICFEEMLHAAFGSPDSVFGELGFALPLVHSEVDFTSPLHFGDRPLVRVTCFRLGRSSIGLRYRVRRADTECVDARMVTTCVDLETMDPIEIPADYRGAFERIREPLPDPA